jgi:hypothetical protein
MEIPRQKIIFATKSPSGQQSRSRFGHQYLKLIALRCSIQMLQLGNDQVVEETGLLQKNDGPSHCRACDWPCIDIAHAQPWPNRPIRIMILFGPGGFADITLLLPAQKLTERTGRDRKRAGRS